MRLSLAGAQNKLPVIVNSAGQICLPGSHISTHILKPPSDRFAALVENELLCMRTAKKVLQDVPEVTLQPFITTDGIQRDCYLIKRYDRYATDTGEIHRLHQEDLCQITGTVSPQKYTQDGGPGFIHPPRCPVSK
jgi:serine/threonine-protein kinase HipA